MSLAALMISLYNVQYILLHINPYTKFILLHINPHTKFKKYSYK